MNSVAVALAVGLALALGLLVAAWMRGRDLDARLATALDEGEQALDQARSELEDARARLETHAAQRAAAEAHLESTEARLDQALAEKQSAESRAESARAKAVEAEKQGALKAQEAAEMRQRMADWDRARAESLDAAKSAVLKTAQQVSSKLIEDHQRESQAARKDTAERITKTTEELVGQIKTVTENLATLQSKTGEQEQTLDTVWRALTSPGGAGYFAEIGLENTLKSFGLEKGRDFIMQYAVSEAGVRPDAVVFLPGDTLLVIDAKASKFLLDLAEAEGTEEEETVRQGLVRTMNEHLKQLAGKNYASAVVKSFHDAGRGETVKRIMNIMYLPNEGAVEKVGQADPEFIRKAARNEITVAGPTALASLIAFARVEIELERQAENQIKIVEGTQALMDAIGTFLVHAKTMGNGLRTSTNAYVKLAKSLNGTLLPRVRRLNRLGVRPTRTQEMPGHFPPFELVTIEDDLIEGDAQDPVLPLTDEEDSS
ncbi:DNA recombination protein RmuC [Magnetospira sp. QH-2]|uniref:DNA recombination protein RmuC n=1 Tax=Magnetospira sp. (strain QH-2) TaxID=1288970 RepID=UPI00130E53C5|nr:DNA recombination protein RmuC [Magnetospira sp. QH-2]